MAIEYLDGNMPDASDAIKQMAKMGRKELKKFASTNHEGLPEKVKEEMECGSDDDKKKKIDPRQLKTIKSRMRTTLGLMGITASYEPEGDVIDERRREEKGTPRKPRDPAFEFVAKSMGSNRLGVQPRGVKKDPGQKPPVAGEYGAPESPAQKLAKRKTEPTKVGSRLD
jgi:hypothetical protein